MDEHGEMAAAGLLHLRETFVATFVQLGGHDFAGHHLVDPGRLGVASRDDHARHQVALREDADEAFAVKDGHGADTCSRHTLDHVEDDVARVGREESAIAKDLLEAVHDWDTSRSGPKGAEPVQSRSTGGAAWRRQTDGSFH